MAWVLAAVLALPLLVLAVLSRWGVLIAVVVAVTVALGIWVWQRGFVFVEIVAFLIHFDGIGAGPLRMGRILAASAAILLVVKLIKGWKPPAIPLRHWLPVGAMLAWAVASGFWSQRTSGWLFTFGVFGLGVAYFCITGLLIESHRMIQQFLRAFWVGGLVGSVAGILALFLGMRAVGFGADPNAFGLIQASMIPLTIYYRRHASTQQATWLYTIALMVVLAGAAGAGSRSGLIGGAIAIVGTMVTRPGLAPGRRARVGVGSLFVAAIAFAVGFVANPANLQRGFSDRGAGRLDLWQVSIALIKENPLIGHGLGQLGLLVPPRLLLTPGSRELNEMREAVSAHNLWLDTVGDLGLIGLGIFLTVFAVAIIGLLRPQWFHTRELSTTLFVMMLPVLSGSFFLPLLNNKLAWALIGLSASLAVPSASSRWSGIAKAMRGPAGPAGPGGPGSALVPAGAPPPERVEPIPGERPPVAGEEVWPSVPLARWDRGVSRRQRATILVVAVLAAFGGSTVGSLMPATYRASAGVLVPAVDGSAGTDSVRFDRERLQGALTLGVSGAFAQELQQRAGLELGIDEIRDRLDATRPRMGLYVEYSFTDTDRANVEAVMPHMIDAMDQIFADVQDLAVDDTEYALRPLIPGESRVYTGPAYLHGFSEPGFGVIQPRGTWYAFVGFILGALVATGFMLAGQRRPRVTNTDDLSRHVGLSVWAHVGGRRRRTSRDQYAQVLATARSMLDPESPAPRIVIAPPRRNPLARRLVSGLGAELAAQGVRTVLVDADLHRPFLSARLGGFGRAGLNDLAGGAELSAVVRRVRRVRLPALQRRALAGATDRLRLIPAGRRPRVDRGYALDALAQLDPDVAVIVLAPPTLGSRPVSELLEWADAVVLSATVGQTSTHDLEDAAAQAAAFVVAPTGVVLLDG
ncbi:MAG: O-antigen ligase family protein [Microthrixaceae bacterium]